MEQDMRQQNQVKNKVDSLYKCILVAAVSMGVTDAAIRLRKLVPEGKLLAEQRMKKVAGALSLDIEAEPITAAELGDMPLPAMAQLKDGRYVLIGQSSPTRILIFFPENDRPVGVDKAEFLAAWTGRIWLISKQFRFADWFNKLNLPWFTPIILHFKKFFFEVVIASFFLQFFGLILPLFTQVIIDKVIGNNGVSTLDVLAGALIIAGLFQALMGIVRTYLLTHTTNKIDVILGARLFRHVLSLPLQYFENRRVGDILIRVGAMNSIREFLTGSALTGLLDAFFAVLFLIVMLNYSVTLTGIAMISLPFYLAQNILVTPAYQKRLQAVWTASAESNAFLVESVTGIHTMKSMALEPQFNYRWEGLVAKYVHKTFQNSSFNLLITSCGSMIDRVSSLAILWYGGYLVMKGQMTLGQLIAFQMLASQASAPILRLVGMWQTVQQTTLAMERLGDILNTRPESILAAGNIPKQSLQGEIRLDNVTFRYRPDHDPVLNGVSLHVPAGSRIGIVGRSGSGKSTLTKLIQRLYLPEAGTVSIDGLKVEEVDNHWLRRQIGVVMQENYLFNGSVRENIAAAIPAAAMEDIIRVAQLAGAHDFILELPEGYDTSVGERGTALSGGQRQRIAIARALLTNPRILIFDEATSALDYESERIIMDNLQELSAGRTMLMIAHRLSTVRHCDKIVVVDKGCIVEEGTHEQLMECQGIYHLLYEQQEG